MQLLYCIPRVTRTTCILFDLSYLGVVHSCRRIIQKRIVRTKLNIYVFMFTCDVLIFCLDTTCTTELWIYVVHVTHELQYNNIHVVRVTYGIQYNNIHVVRVTHRIQYIKIENKERANTTWVGVSDCCLTPKWANFQLCHIENMLHSRPPLLRSTKILQ
jgi:hypothetical protein